MTQQNLPERLQQVINESKEALTLCRSLAKGPNIGLSLMASYIEQAEKALVSGDCVLMIQAVKSLEGYLQ